MDKKTKITVAILVLFLISLLLFPAVISAESSNLELESPQINYKFTTDDAWMLVEPAVCSVTAVYFAYVYDPQTAMWSEAYTYGPLSGTGFVVNPETGIIITAGHMVDEVEVNYVGLKWTILQDYFLVNYPDIVFEMLPEEELNKIYDSFKVEGLNSPYPDQEIFIQFNLAQANIPDIPGENQHRAEVVNLSNRNNRDIAVLKITPLIGQGLSSVLLGDSSNIFTQDEVIIIGYPWTSFIGQSNQLNPTVTKGSLSGKVIYQGNELLQIQGDARPGNSGGPVIGPDGSLIGMLTMGTDNTNNYLRPSNDIKSMLNVENILGKVDTEWRIGLAMFKQSHFSEAVKHFGIVLNLSAGHLLAQEYLAKAQENMDKDIPLAAETASQTSASTAGSIVNDNAAAQENAGVSPKIMITAIAVPIAVILLSVFLLLFLIKRRNSNVKPAAIPDEEKKQIVDKSDILHCNSCGIDVKTGQITCHNCGVTLKNQDEV
ncbi:MAG: trypsin-like peptidase domain-containing protein [Candidatus Humimicrobiaceae bacterium]